jgi:hypothetical protein
VDRNGSQSTALARIFKVGFDVADLQQDADKFVTSQLARIPRTRYVFPGFIPVLVWSMMGCTTSIPIAVRFPRTALAVS